MYYVTTENKNYEITTSYVTEKQARRYGGEPFQQELYLVSDGMTYEVVDFPEIDKELTNIGLVRTILKNGGSGVKAGDFLLYIPDDDNGWKWSGIFFSSLSDANQALKTSLSYNSGNLLIVELEDVYNT